MKDIKTIKDKLPKLRDEERAPINALPEYTIRTMKDDLGRLGLKELEKEAKESREVKILREKLKEREISPPEELPVAPPKAPLPTTEELITEKPEKLPSPSAPPTPTVSRVERPTVSKPTIPKIKKTRILIFAIIIFLILVGIGAFFYWRGKEQPLPPSEPEAEAEAEAEAQTPEPSISLILVDETRIISLLPEASFSDSLKQDIMQESRKEQEIGTFKRIAILKNETEFLSLGEFFNELRINIPPYVLGSLGENYTLVLYNQNGTKHLCLIADVEDPENLKEQLRFWEETMVNDLENFFLGKARGEPSTSEFQDNTYEEMAIRYINFPEPDLTIDYSIINNLFILTTSRESMYRIIDKIKM